MFPSCLIATSCAVSTEWNCSSLSIWIMSRTNIQANYIWHVERRNLFVDVASKKNPNFRERDLYSILNLRKWIALKFLTKCLTCEQWLTATISALWKASWWPSLHGMTYFRTQGVKGQPRGWFLKNAGLTKWTSFQKLRKKVNV